MHDISFEFEATSSFLIQFDTITSTGATTPITTTTITTTPTTTTTTTGGGGGQPTTSKSTCLTIPCWPGAAEDLPLQDWGATITFRGGGRRALDHL